MKKIDTHQHLLYPDEFNYAWTADEPTLQAGFPLDAYWSSAEGCEVEGTIFMEVDVDPDQSGREARFMCELAEDPANRICSASSPRPARSTRASMHTWTTSSIRS